MTETAVEAFTPSLPDHARWRSEPMAELALFYAGARVYKALPKQGEGYRFVAAAGPAVFFVRLAEFSSTLSGLPGANAAPVWHRTVPADDIRGAVGSRIPVALFVFDVDTEHGRFLRLDTLPEPPADAETVTLELPVENAITRESVQRLIDEFAAARR